MVNQKLCCESGRVRVSYKIPVRHYCKKAYKVQFNYTATYNNYAFEGNDPRNGSTVSGSFFYVNTFGQNDNFNVWSPFIFEFSTYARTTGQYRLLGIDRYDWIPDYDDPIDIIFLTPVTLDDPVQSSLYNSRSLLDPRWVRASFYLANIERLDGIPPDQDFAECGSYDNYTGCVYPTEWQYFDVETPKFNARDLIKTVLKYLDILDQIRLLDPLDPLIKRLELILEGIKRLSLLRTCVVAGEQFLNSNKINIALGLEIGVLENITLPFVGLDLQVNFWQPVPGFDQIIKTIESPTGCPPPLVKLECCPETGCDEECPEGTCPVDCGDFICCYNNQGISVKKILK